MDTIELGRRSDIRARALRWLVTGWGHVQRWRECARARRQLLTMDDHLLKDIGITRHDAEDEARRPFWQI